MRKLAAISLLLAAPAAAQTPGFWLVGTAPGTNTSYAQSLSQNGSVAVGYSYHFGISPGFTWTQAGGRHDFGLAPGMPEGTLTYGVDSDGNAIVGRMGGPAADRAFRRVGSDPLQDLGAGGYQYSAATGVSGDGSVVAVNGTSTVQGIPTGQAFRWTESGGLQALGWLHGSGRLSQANGVSRDGTTIVGQSAAGPASEAFVWRQGTGMQPLLPPAGWSSLDSIAYAANADGTAIVGYATAPDNSTRLIRWTPGGPQDLGSMVGYAVSDDGQVIGGVAGNAAVWTPATGVLSLSDFLSPYGVSIPLGWTARHIYAVSGDGLTFAGEAFSTSGVSEGFVATIPAPSGAALVLFPALLCTRRRRA